MKVVALISGGKDSCYNIMQCIAAKHDIVALANIEPKSHTEIDSYMYQSVGHEAINLMAEAMQLPLYRYQTSGASYNRGINYIPTQNDEVEDLYELLSLIKKDVQIDAVSVGAILSDYQRVRVENVCSRLALVSLAYLWQRDQNELLREMIECQVDAIIIKVAALGLEPSRHLGRSLRLIEPHLHNMHDKYGLNVCGEGGEYETLVLDCPLYSSRIVIEESEVIMHSDDPIAPVGYLKLNQLKLETKLPHVTLYERLLSVPLKDSDGYITDYGEEASDFIDEETIDEVDLLNQSDEKGKIETTVEYGQTLSYSKTNNGWLWIGGITGDSEDCCTAMINVLEKLKSTLMVNEHELKDVSSVCLYISDMSKFGALNKLYVEMFDHINPPSRACVEVPLPKSCPIILEASSWIPPSDTVGDALINRNTLHVQSLSHWAPANIGPYSQAVCIGELIYVSGQIGLIPGSMELVKGGIKCQCQLTLRHVNRILKVMDSKLRDVVQAICFVTDIKLIEKARILWEAKTNNAIVDYVVVSALPRGALIEWHVWAHKHNNTFEYEETGKCIDNWSISIFRRWNYENILSAIVCHLDHSKNFNAEVTVDICRATFEYLIEKLQGHAEKISTISLKIFCNVKNQIPVDSMIEILNDFKAVTNLVYTVVPVVDLYNENTCLSVSGLCIH